VESGGMEQQELRQAVQQAVERVLAEQLPRLQSDLVERVLQTLPSMTAAAAPAAIEGAGTGQLLQEIGNIHQGATQKEILRALLDAAGAHCARIALFVVKAGAATGWQGRGFENDDAVKDFPLDIAAGPVSHAYHNRIPAPANIAEMDRHFVERFGGPANEQVLLVPLLLKDKVAALLYADGGGTGTLDAASLELLVVTTGAWLEVVSLRKQSQREVGEAAPAERAPAPAPVQTVSSFSDPFASHAPKHIAPHAAEPEPAAEVVEVAQAGSGTAAAPATATDPFAGLSAEDAETHRKAQRFARLLVDEIKLYNQAKVSEGRRNRDLYDRLKDDIEKSRTTYHKRYGNTVAASGDYFQKEVVRSLAEDDLSLMGASFKK
jgi:hypothetical protein